MGEKNFICLFVGTGLNCIFHWQAHWLIFSKSVLSSVTDLFMSRTFEEKDASSANILHIEVIPSGRSLYKSDIKVVLRDPCETPDLIFLHPDVWPFKITHNWLMFTTLKIVISTQHCMTFNEKWDHHAKLCQMFWKCQENHLSHQQKDCYLKLFVFHVLLIVTGPYMSLLEENLIEKA